MFFALPIVALCGRPVNACLIALFFIVGGASSQSRAAEPNKLTQLMIEEQYTVGFTAQAWTLRRRKGKAHDCLAVLKPLVLSDPKTPAHIVLHPAPRSSNKPGPYLTILADATSTMHSILHSNQRTEVKSLSQRSPVTFWSGPLQKALERSEPFFLTWLVPKLEKFSSARFDPSGIKSVLREMEKTCHIHLDEIARNPARNKSDESALKLSLNEKSHIHFVLHGLYAEDAQAPPAKLNWPPGRDFRNNLLRFTRENGLPATYFLTASTSRLLLRRKISPNKAVRTAESKNSKKHGDWRSFREKTPSGWKCVLETQAEGRKGPLSWSQPQLRLVVRDGGSASDLEIIVASNNPFSKEAPVMSEVDGEDWFTLNTSGTRLLKSYDKKPFVRAMQEGRKITVLGREASTRLPLEFSFSAIGYSAGFKRISKLCNASGIVSLLN